MCNNQSLKRSSSGIIFKSLTLRNFVYQLCQDCVGVISSDLIHSDSTAHQLLSDSDSNVQRVHRKKKKKRYRNLSNEISKAGFTLAETVCSCRVTCLVCHAQTLYRIVKIWSQLPNYFTELQSPLKSDTLSNRDELILNI